MRRWFQTPQWLCSVCHDRVRLEKLLESGTFFPDGKVECHKCTLGGRRLKQFMFYLSTSNITA